VPGSLTLAKVIKELGALAGLGASLGMDWKNQSAAALVASTSQLYLLSRFPPSDQLDPRGLTAAIDGAPYSLIPYTPGWIRYCPDRSHALMVTVTAWAAALFRTVPSEVELMAPASILELPRLAILLAPLPFLKAAPVVTAVAAGPAVVDLL